ncbi:MAG: hypothetical protein JJE52_18670, partial [Acidimicrobiia bacterium]|nr:hypothetical protein [Acidimicrobiia bacterium]
MTDDQGGIATFVGRVTGRLDATERAWVTTTSERIDELRTHLGEAHGRIAALETATANPPLPDGGWPGPAGVDTDLARELGFAVAELRGQQLVDELLTAGILAAPPGATGTIAFGPADSWDLDLTAPGGGTIARADVMLAATATEIVQKLAANPLVDVVYASTDATDRLAERSIAAPTPVDLVVVRPGSAWPAAATGPIVVDVGVTAADLDEGLAEVRATLGADGRSAAAGDAPTAILDAAPLLA